MKDDVETIHQSIQAFIDELEKENESLYLKLVDHIKNKEKNWERRIQEMEDHLALMSSTLAKIKENESIGIVTNEENHLKTSTIIKEEKVEQKELHVHEELENNPPLITEDLSDNEDTESVPSLQNQDEPQDHYQKAQEMYHQGFSIDQIAKILKIGKGEASLIINMIKKKKENQQ